MDREIFLIRHGKIDYGYEKRYIGITDLPLSDAGVSQALKLKKYFSGMEIEKVFISSLKRCMQTAEIIFDGSNVNKIMVDEFKEINMGEWENHTINYIKCNFPEAYKKRGLNIDVFIPPRGESFEQLQQRVMTAFNYIVQNTSGNVVIISHVGVNRVILSKLLDFPLKDIFKISQPYGCINKLSLDIACRRWQWEELKCEELIE